MSQFLKIYRTGLKKQDRQEQTLCVLCSYVVAKIFPGAKTPMCAMFQCGYKDNSKNKDTYVCYVPMWLQRYSQEQRHLCVLRSYVVAKIFPGAKTPMCAMFQCGCKAISRSKDTNVRYVPMWLKRYFKEQRPMFLCGYKFTKQWSL